MSASAKCPSTSTRPECACPYAQAAWVFSAAVRHCRTPTSFLPIHSSVTARAWATEAFEISGVGTGAATSAPAVLRTKT